MNEYRKGNKALLALLLIFSLLLGQITAPAVAAEARSGATISVSEDDADGLWSAVEKLNNEGGGTITLLGGEYDISKPLNVSTTITIKGSGTIIPVGDGWNSYGGDDKKPYGSMITVEGPNVTLYIENGITVDAIGQCRAINVASGASLYLDGCTITNGKVLGTNGGAGVYVGAGKCSLYAAGGTQFVSNKADLSAPTSGGALYVGADSNADLQDVSFFDNEAHSGGAIYTYHGLVTCTADTKFTGHTEEGLKGNRASQRGGAIHSHGLVCLYGTTIEGQSSDQFGGAIYVSANKTGETFDFGRLVLHGALISGNTCGNSGGGVYVADQAQALVSNGAQVYGNKIVGSSDPGEPDASNVFVATANSKLIVSEPLTGEAGKIGVSTSNPYDEKTLVYSLVPAYLPENKEDPDSRTEIEKYFASGFPTNYTMTSADMSKFKYDSEVFFLEQGNGAHQNDMWLKMNKNYPGGGGSTDPCVIFDLNLPGKPVITYPNADKPTLTVGEPLEVPKVEPAVIESGLVTYTFLGWYSDAMGGTHYPSSVTVGEGTRVYYAHWDVSVPDHGGEGVAGTAGLQLVYYDKNYVGGGYTTAYTFGGQFTFMVEFPTSHGPETRPVDVYVPFELPKDPVREGYKFNGWSENAGGPGGIKHGSGWAPSKAVTTLFAQWTANTYTLNWDATSGTGSCETKQNYDETVKAPTTPPTKTGYEFTGWYLDKNCTIPLTSGTLVRGDATFYAGWTPKEYTITWDANYTGGTITTVKQHHDEKLNILPKPTREGYEFGGWYTQPGGAGTRAEGYGTVREDVTFYAKWTNETLDYTVRLEWDDQSNNDNVRPESITVSLMANDIPTGLSYTLDASDADDSGNIWSYTFEGLDVTDAVSNPITYSVAITSSVSDEYTYGIANNSATKGYILMTHSLITRDVDTYVVWDDNSDQDGIRPATVSLRLFANGKPVDDQEAKVALSGSGNTWFYQFRDVQKYYSTETEKGLEYDYTIEATPTNSGELEGYDEPELRDYTIILRHKTATVSRTVNVVWQDSNNQDGKRPVNMMVQLYADNVPLEGKTVTLSDANKWTYTWDDLDKYTNGGREVVYSARVTSTLVDYTAKSTGMTIEMTYVPSSTSISAFVTWTDENDADGLRPDFITAQLVADGKPTGDSQVLSAVNGWTTTWNNYPIYKNGDRIEYTFQIDVPNGYEATYHGVYDTSGLSAVLTHARLKQNLTGNIVWEDKDDQSGGRMGRVAVLLYADGSVIDEDDKVWISAGDNWEHIFADLPIYRDHGEEIKYSMVLVSDPGKYVATTSKMTITMNLEPEYVDVPFQIIWDDDNDSDGVRPDYVAVTLMVDGKPSPYGETATPQGDWAVTFSHLDRYGANGLYLYRPELVEVPDGYTAIRTSPSVVVLKRVAETKDVTATVTWLDNNNQYRERPEQVTLTLYADYLDGNGPQNTGRIEKCKATEGWTFTFKDVLARSGGKNVVYSVVASGLLPNYTISYDGMDVYLTHKSYSPNPVNMQYEAKVVWHDGHNADGSRPLNLLVTLYADGKSCKTETLTEANLDATGYTWRHTFTELPTKVDGKDVTYTIAVTAPAHYTSKTQGNTITLTHVMDIPILVRWHDQQDNDGFRPETLTLELFGDSIKTDTAISLTGPHDAETWRGSFRQVPVWSDAQMDRKITYTWAFAGNSLAGSNYTVEYNKFTVATVDNEDLYPIDINRSGDVMDVSVFVKWDDDNDRDGLRSKSDTVVILYADGQATDKTMKLTGSDEAESWTGTFKDLPVRNDGTPIVYSIDVAPKAGYTVDYNHTTPFNVTMTHKPAEAEVKATVKWDKTVKDKFDIAADLLVDGEPRFDVGILDETNGYEVSWGMQYVYRDHGQPIDYTVRVAEQTKIPEWHVAEPEGLTINVKRVKFELTGRVLNDADEEGKRQAIPTALVTLTDLKADKILGQVFTDAQGRFAFTVGSSDYRVQANVSLPLMGREQQVDIKDLNFDTNVDVIFQEQIPLCECTIQVKKSDGDAASKATVDVERPSQGYFTTLEPNDSGVWTVTLPYGNYNFHASFTDEDGNCYRATLDKPFFYGSKQTFTITLPPEGTSTVYGTVLSDDNEPVPNIVVECYIRGSDGLVGGGRRSITNDKGKFSFGKLPDGTYEVILKDQSGETITLDEDVLFTIPRDTGSDLTIWLPRDYGEDPPRSGSGTLSGIALDKTGRPVGDAKVLVTDKATGRNVNVLTTGADGTFEIQLPVGEYAVEIQKPFDNNTNHPIRVDDEAASKEDGPVTADSFTVSGFVLDEDDQPVEGATVYLYREDGQLVQTIFVEDDAQESAPAEDEIPAIAKTMVSSVAETVKEAVATKMEEVLAEIVPAEEDEMAEEPASEAEELTANEGEDTSEEAPAEPDAADAELVADEPTGDNTADLFAEDGFIRLDERVTGEDGKYVFTRLPAGRYVVKIAQGIGGNGGSTDIPITVQPLPEIPDDADLTVTTDSYTVTGVVEGKYNTPVGNASVKLLDDQGEEVARMTTGADGVYAFANLSKGDYTVNISYPDSELLASGDVTITDGGFTAFPGQVVDGTLKDNKGNTLANVTVTVHGEDGKTYTATTNKDGNYRVVVPDGKYTVEVNINGKTASKTITVSGKPVTVDLTVTLSSGSGSGSGGSGGGSGSGGSGGGSGSGGSGGIGGGGSGSGGSGSVTEQPKVVLSGVVLDKDGNGVVGATITAVDTKTGETYTATTGLDGKYALAVPKGNYTITITYGSTTTNPKKVTVSKDAKLDNMTMDNLGKLVYGYVKGYGDGTFGGGRSITRSEVAALISRISPDFDASHSYAFDFKDVPENAWYAKNLGYCVEAGLIQGRGNGHFDPNANITRAEFAAIVARFLGLPNEVVDTKVFYTDTENNWAEGYIAQLTAKGIVEGKGDGKFDPTANISRYEAVTMLNRALGRTPDKAALDGLMSNLVIRAFPDLQVDHWAYYQVLEAAFDHYHK